MTPVYGLILCGGKSTRMGSDKCLLNYHGKPQREHLEDLLSHILPKVFISTRSSQLGKGKNLIEDKFEIDSPLNGILSAFNHMSEVAWLVVACDMPLIDVRAIELLLKNRNTNCMATCFLDTDDQPNPLLAIYEPSALAALKKHSQKSRSPRKFLMNTNTHFINTANKDFLKNINTPEAYHQFMKHKN